MISGTQALSSIDRAITESTRRTGSLTDQLARVRDDLLDWEKQRAEAIERLAKIKLDRVAKRDFGVNRDEAETKASRLLEQRSALESKLNDRLRHIEAKRAELDNDLTAASQRRDDLARTLDMAEAGVQSRLEKDPDYIALRDDAKQAESQAVRARQKADQSAAELDQKGQAYRDDPLFMYLWNRKYGDAGYTGGGLFRWLDAKVANLIAYPEARLGFARLNELPVRLGEHADRLRARAEDRFQALRAAEEKALTSAGLDSERRSLAEAEAEVESLTHSIQESLDLERQTRAELAALAAGEDPVSRDALAILATDLGREDLAVLEREARETPFPEDDAVVAALITLDQRKAELAEARKTLKDALATERDRLRDIQGLRAKYRRQRYDAPGAGFGNEDTVTTVMDQFLRGAVTSGAFWNVLRQAERSVRQSRPTFGSGGFGHGGSIWSAGGMGGLGRGISRGGGMGGHRGGFGGGSFRTGGGF